jgi:hypothetical protein
LSTHWKSSEGRAVDPYLSPEACREKALDCLIRADTLEDPRQKAAMLKYADWWMQLAEYRSGRTANEGTAAPPTPPLKIVG